MIKMNEALISAILSPTGRKLLKYFPTTKESRLNIEQIAELAGVPTTSAYRHIKDLKKWNNNIVTIERKTGRGPPEYLYYIKSKIFTIQLKNTGTELRVIQNV